MIVAGRHDGGRGDDEQRPDVVVGEAVVGGPVAVARGGRLLVLVVVVDQAHVDLAPTGRLHDRAVVRVVASAVGDHVVEPLGGGFGAVLVAEHGEPVEEGAVGGGNGDPAAVAVVGELEHRLREIGAGHRVEVVDQHTLASGEPDPGARLRAVLWRRQVEHLGADGAEQAPALEEADRAGRARQEHVGRGAVPLLGEQQGQIGGASPAGLDLGAGLAGEGLQGRADEVLGAAGVDNDAAAAAAGALAGVDLGGGPFQGSGLSARAGSGQQGREQGGDDNS